MDLSTFTLQRLQDSHDSLIDCVCLVGASLDDFNGRLTAEVDALRLMQEHDANKSNLLAAVVNQRLVLYQPVGNMKNDYADVRIFNVAAKKVVARAMSAGKTNLAFHVNLLNNGGRTNLIENEFGDYKLVAIAGALEATYIDLQTRERPEYKNKVINLYTPDLTDNQIEFATIFEQGYVISRDTGGADPERTAPPAVAEYVQKAFAGIDSIKVQIVDDQDEIAREYPSFHCVNRATKNVPRHHGRIIFLDYRSADNAPTQHLGIVGKGVTYDTGGADIKAGGVMAGMHRDKCGACNAIGFMYIVGKLQPKNINITTTACMVRNSVGSECYVADEVYRSRAGRYVRVCNTDAEGRMAMVDLLALTKEKAIKDNWVNPRLLTIATLTGHAVIAFDEGYAGVLSNGPGQKQQLPQKLFAAGHAVGEPIELSTLRQNDIDASTCTDGYAECKQSGNGASTRTPRGHQQPVGFMLLASGLDRHGLNSEKPIAYTHLDIAGAAGPYPGLPTGHPIRALYRCFCE